MGFGVKMAFGLKLIKARETQKSDEFKESAWVYDLVLEFRPRELNAQTNISVQTFHWARIDLVPEHLSKSRNIFSIVDRLSLSCTKTTLEMDLVCDAPELFQQSFEKCRRTLILNTTKMRTRGANEL